VLIQTISNLLVQQRAAYTRHSCIVNSSGTGKSRMVDQVATEIITVPMCLREDGSQGCTFHTPLLTCLSHYPSGFPPPDKRLRNWFISLPLGGNNEHQITRKLHAFMTSLLTLLREHLVKLDVQDGEYPVFCPRLRANNIAYSCKFNSQIDHGSKCGNNGWHPSSVEK